MRLWIVDRLVVHGRQRDYRVNSDLIRRELGFKVTRRVSDGIREVMEVVRLGLVSDPDDQRYYNIPYKRPQ